MSFHSVFMAHHNVAEDFEAQANAEEEAWVWCGVVARGLV